MKTFNTMLSACGLTLAIALPQTWTRQGQTERYGLW